MNVNPINYRKNAVNRKAVDGFLLELPSSFPTLSEN